MLSPPPASQPRVASQRRDASLRHESARERYLAAWRWRRAVEAELRSLGLTFTQWLVLEATDELVRETRDAVSQTSVALRTELDHGTTSLVMKALAARSLVDRGPDMAGPAYRIIVTQAGRRLVRRVAERIENVAG